MKKICFVVQRYGEEVNGGAEQLCRALAERLVHAYDVTVVTTKAIEYDLWKDYYLQETEEIMGVHVRRFSVKRTRDKLPMIFLHHVFHEKWIGIQKLENIWIDAQGPYCPALVEWLRQNKKNYDLFLFFTYLYYPAVRGIPVVLTKSVFVPTAHDEPYLYMSIMKPLFRKCRGILYLTKEEKRLVNRVFHNEDVPSIIGGCGIDIPETIDREYMRKQGIDNYVVYVGRLDAAKGCKTLFRYFADYRRKYSEDLHLVLVGKGDVKVPTDPYIHALGFVSEKAKVDVVGGAKALILPSQFESLSMVVLEAMAEKMPVLVNGKCEVTKEHCIQSGAGLYYTNEEEFERSLHQLVTDAKLRGRMGENGVQYIKNTYSWNVVISQLMNFMDGLMRETSTV